MILFVDLDGVILPVGALAESEARAILVNPFDHLDVVVSKTPKHTAAHIRTLAEQTEAWIVVISTWRGLFPEEFIRAYLEQLGLLDILHKRWMAPMRGLPPRPRKASDIGEWLSTNRVAQKDCLVIDDDDLDLRGCGFRVLLQVQPISNIGFSRDDLVRALKILQATPADATS